MVSLIVNVFPNLEWLPHCLSFLVSNSLLASLPNKEFSDDAGQTIMCYIRQTPDYEPSKYFEFTLRHHLYRDHAELQWQHGVSLLSPAKPEVRALTEAQTHFLLALAYGLHERCYSFGMRCLKRLALISLQMEVTQPVLHLDSERAFRLMCQESFPFALVIAVAYDLDTEENWGVVIFEQVILKPNFEFLRSYELFRYVDRRVCEQVAKLYGDLRQVDKGVKQRMEQFMGGIRNLMDRYRIASELGMGDMIASLRQTHPAVCEWCEKVVD
jgi:spatacsin